MSSHNAQSSDLAIVQELIERALSLMEEFPRDYLPPKVPLPESESAKKYLDTADVEGMLSDPQNEAWLKDIIQSWPSEFLPVFVQSSNIIAQILDRFGVNKDQHMLLYMAMSDPRVIELMNFIGHLKEASSREGGDENEDPLRMREVIIKEIQRIGLEKQAPFARTITTLLGDDALLWLTATGRGGMAKLQPHEFSRTGWRDIWSIENQIRIEQELLQVPPHAQYLAKTAVTLCWTLTALASFISPSVFVTETLPHLSSTRGNQLTISRGTRTHTIVSFRTDAMMRVVRVLATGLTDPLLSAADLMWIAAALATVHEVSAGHTEATVRREERFDLFLSHRGRDAKQLLSQNVQAVTSHGIFLDCLTLPHGVINRSFIYGSLARSDRILIVETENFAESEWCRKEAWFADAMAACGMVTAERVTLSEASARIAKDGPSVTRQRFPENLAYPITPRVLRDIDYWGRAPNLCSLKESGYSTETLEPLQHALEQYPAADNPDWARSLSAAVTDTLSQVVAESQNAEPFDFWATALQFSLAALGSTSNARSKMEVRQGVDQLNAALKSLVTSDLHTDAIFCRHAASYLALLAASTVIQLANFELDQQTVTLIQNAIGDTARLRDGLLLLDVRRPGQLREFRLRLAALLVQASLGSVGIVQDASDQIHEGEVDGLPLEILPCITMYPGMKSPFEKETAIL